MHTPSRQDEVAVDILTASNALSRAGRAPLPHPSSQQPTDGVLNPTPKGINTIAFSTLGTPTPAGRRYRPPQSVQLGLPLPSLPQKPATSISQVAEYVTPISHISIPRMTEPPSLPPEADPAIVISRISALRRMRAERDGVPTQMALATRAQHTNNRLRTRTGERRRKGAAQAKVSEYAEHANEIYARESHPPATVLPLDWLKMMSLLNHEANITTSSPSTAMSGLYGQDRIVSTYVADTSVKPKDILFGRAATRKSAGTDDKVAQDGYGVKASQVLSAMTGADHFQDDKGGLDKQGRVLSETSDTPGTLSRPLQSSSSLSTPASSQPPPSLSDRLFDVVLGTTTARIRPGLTDQPEDVRLRSALTITASKQLRDETALNTGQSNPHLVVGTTTTQTPPTTSLITAAQHHALTRSSGTRRPAVSHSGVPVGRVVERSIFPSHNILTHPSPHPPIRSIMLHDSPPVEQTGNWLALGKVVEATARAAESMAVSAFAESTRLTSSLKDTESSYGVNEGEKGNGNGNDGEDNAPKSLGWVKANARSAAIRAATAHMGRSAVTNAMTISTTISSPRRNSPHRRPSSRPTPHQPLPRGATLTRSLPRGTRRSSLVVNGHNQGVAPMSSETLPQEQITDAFGRSFVSVPLRRSVVIPPNLHPLTPSPTTEVDTSLINNDHHTDGHNDNATPNSPVSSPPRSTSPPPSTSSSSCPSPFAPSTTASTTSTLQVSTPLTALRHVAKVLNTSSLADTASSRPFTSSRGTTHDTSRPQTTSKTSRSSTLNAYPSAYSNSKLGTPTTFPPVPLVEAEEIVAPPSWVLTGPRIAARRGYLSQDTEPSSFLSPADDPLTSDSQPIHESNDSFLTRILLLAEREEQMLNRHLPSEPGLGLTGQNLSLGSIRGHPVDIALTTLLGPSGASTTPSTTNTTPQTYLTNVSSRSATTLRGSTKKIESVSEGGKSLLDSVITKPLTGPSSLASEVERRKQELLLGTREFDRTIQQVLGSSGQSSTSDHMPDTDSETEMSNGTLSTHDDRESEVEKTEDFIKTNQDKVRVTTTHPEERDPTASSLDNQPDPNETRVNEGSSG